MKTTNLSDRLDHEINKLLASQPLRPSDGFSGRVLAATSKVSVEQRSSRKIYFWQRLTLPVAALLVASFIINYLAATRTGESATSTLTSIELQEIFIFEEGLVGLTQVQDDDFNNTQLLKVLNQLNRETKS